MEFASYRFGAAKWETEKITKNKSGETYFLRVTLPMRPMSTLINDIKKILSPCSSIIALHDRCIFSSKPSTLGFTGSAIKSCGGLEWFRDFHVRRW